MIKVRKVSGIGMYYINKCKNVDYLKIMNFFEIRYINIEIKLILFIKYMIVRKKIFKKL